MEPIVNAPDLSTSFWASNAPSLKLIDRWLGASHNFSSPDENHQLLHLEQGPSDMSMSCWVTIYTIIRRRAVAGSINQSTSDREISWSEILHRPCAMCVLRPPVSVRVFYYWAACWLDFYFKTLLTKGGLARSEEWEWGQGEKYLTYGYVAVVLYWREIRTWSRIWRCLLIFSCVSPREIA